jgi:hypothetical protein
MPLLDERESLLQNFDHLLALLGGKGFEVPMKFL